MKVASAPGPEQLTLTERIVGLTRLPYFAGCVVIGLIIGFPGFFLASFLETMDLTSAVNQSLANPFFSITEFGKPVSVAQGVGEATLWTLFLILTLYFARFMRLKLLRAEPVISQLTDDGGEERYHSAFGGASSWRYSLPLALAFLTVYLPVRLLTSTGPNSYLSSAVLLPVDFIFVGISLWVYLRSLWGIYKFGQERLILRPYHADGMFGLRPLGSISLSFAIVLMILVVIALAGSFVSSDLSNLSVQLVLLCFLIVMIFLPLNGIHKKMIEARSTERQSVEERIRGLTGGSSTENSQNKDESSTLIEIRTIVALRVLKEETSKMPAWPFDTRRLERFIAVFLSVIAIIIARLIQVALHL